MSRIYFHTRDNSIEVPGSERAHFGWTCSQLFLLAVHIFIEETPKRRSPFREILPNNHYVMNSYPVPTSTYKEGTQFQRILETALSVGFDLKLLLNGKEEDLFAIQLNTALVAGSDPIKLGARLHGQCEIHGYIDERNAKWFAGIIQQGLDIGFLHHPESWISVIHLMQHSRGHIVTSYSVCESFPNHYIAEFGGYEGSQDDWYDLSHDDMWNHAIWGLLAKNEKGQLEIKPETWDTFYFGNDWNGYSLARYLGTL